VSARFSELEADAHEAIEREGIAETRRALLHSMDMRYEGQEHTITVPLGAEQIANFNLAALRRSFDELHEVTYGYAMEDPVEATGYRIRAVGTLDKPSRPSLEPGDASAAGARIGTRDTLHRESGGRFTWDVYSREKLLAGNRLEGPAIVEEASATTVVPPGHELTVDELGNLVITTG
jgi:N-methylhydantoinase A